jgi:triacylglycerol lipase
MDRHHVVLVPGFFGFGSLGQLTYFVGVKEALERAFSRLSPSVGAVNVIEVPTLPTASIRHRAARVHETLAKLARSSPGPIHIVGHSTGGLDARLAIAPTASLPTTIKFHEHDRLRTLVSINTPHFGTPLASFFGSAAGYPILRALAAAVTAILRHGHLPLGLALRMGALLVRADDLLGFKNTIADEFFRDVIADFSAERRAELIAFIDGVSQDQSLIFQLTPAGCDLLNASTADPDSLRYGSVVCAANPPALSSLFAFKHNPYAQSMHALFALLYRIAGFTKTERLPDPVPEQREVLVRSFGAFPELSWSDGIVPTLSQVWGEVIHATRADHLDVVGHYGSSSARRATNDWLPSRSGFDDIAFDALWSDVARFITEQAHEAPRHRRNVGVERTQVGLEEAQKQGTVAPDVVTADERAREKLNELPKPKVDGLLVDGHQDPPAPADAGSNSRPAL